MSEGRLNKHGRSSAIPNYGNNVSISTVNDVLLEIKDLQTHFHTDDGIVRGCDGVSYTVNSGETLAVVGESGSGKSVTAMSILDLIPDPPGKIVGGEILFKGRNLVGLPKEAMQKIRGNEIAMIFQEPMTSLNPVMTAGEQISESLMLHRNMTREAAMVEAVALLKLVGIPAPESRVREYPHQLSGGMRQRVMIAIALACRPKLLIADEPTSALDVTIQAQILRLIKELQSQFGMAVILITHDMGVVAESADKVAVMYCGKVVEFGTAQDIFFSPKHPYLKGLRQSVLTIDETEPPDALYIIEGEIPDPLNLPKGCNFAPRCPERLSICTEKPPEPIYFENGHYACCWRHAPIPGGAIGTSSNGSLSRGSSPSGSLFRGSFTSGSLSRSSSPSGSLSNDSHSNGSS